MPFEHGGLVGPTGSTGAGGLAGRVALVTGGGSGIGQATALLLASAGAHVVVADRDALAAQATVAELASAPPGTGSGPDLVGSAPAGVVVPRGQAWPGTGPDSVGPASAGDAAPRGQALAVEVDVTDPAAVDALVEATVEAFGRIDVAVNAAGISGSYGNIVDQEVDEWRRMIDVNLTSVYLSVRAELRRMLAQDPAGGVIVNVASAAGSMGVPGLAHYSAAKHGVIGLTKSAALEVARRGIRVNVVLPGTVRTPMLQRFAGGDEGVDKMGRITPLGRVAESPEIAQAILWLCTDAASYVTGAALPVDGGALAT